MSRAPCIWNFRRGESEHKISCAAQALIVFILCRDTFASAPVRLDSSPGKVIACNAGQDVLEEQDAKIKIEKAQSRA